MARAAGWRPLAFVGGFSYSLYLIHAPLLQLAWLAVVHPLGLIGLPAFGVTVLAGSAGALAVLT
jgi:peptidoglycan/LPS O-acetylase OafA/YrhL